MPGFTSDDGIALVTATVRVLTEGVEETRLVIFETDM